MRTSLPLTEIWPISDCFINKNTIASLCITVQYALLKIVSDKLSKLNSKLSDIWNYFRTMSDGRRQTESLITPRYVSKNESSWQILKSSRCDLIFCAHFMNIFSFLRGAGLEISGNRHLPCIRKIIGYMRKILIFTRNNKTFTCPTA